MRKILLVDDSSATDLLRLRLERDKYMVDCCSDGFDALATILHHHYDLIILELMTAGLNGVEVCRRFRESGGTTPILMLTSQSSVKDRVTALDAGADDYLLKPFCVEELLARVRALLRRPPKLTPKYLVAGDVLLDVVNRTVTRRGYPVKLIPREIALLELFMTYPDQSFSADSILDRLWDSGPISSEEAVRTHIKTIRGKLGRSIISTRRGIGYMLGPSACEATRTSEPAYEMPLVRAMDHVVA